MIEHFPSLGEKLWVQVSSTCSMLHCGRWLWQESVFVQTCSLWPKICCPFLSAFRFRQDKTSPSGNPFKMFASLMYISIFLPHTARCKKLETFLVTILHWAGERYYGKRHTFSYCLWSGWFCTQMRCSYWSLFTGIWISHKRNSSVYCWIHVFLGEQESLEPTCGHQYSRKFC